MENWVLWFIVAGVMVILELFTGTFYLLMIAIGVAAGGIAALIGWGFSVQFIVAGFVGVLATGLLRRTKLGKIDKGDANRDPNVNLDIGQSVHIEAWSGSEDRWTARVMYRGAMWDVDLAEGETAMPGTYIIREIRGSRLIVTNQESNNHSQ
jgi:membrane protein implicated in regulation of membrane protease activity